MSPSSHSSHTVSHLYLITYRLWLTIGPTYQRDEEFLPEDASWGIRSTVAKKLIPFPHLDPAAEPESIVKHHLGIVIRLGSKRYAIDITTSARPLPPEPAWPGGSIPTRSRQRNAPNDGAWRRWICRTRISGGSGPGPPVHAIDIPISAPCTAAIARTKEDS